MNRGNPTRTELLQKAKDLSQEAILLVSEAQRHTKSYPLSSELMELKTKMQESLSTLEDLQKRAKDESKTPQQKVQSFDMEPC